MDLAHFSSGSNPKGVFRLEQLGRKIPNRIQPSRNKWVIIIKINVM